MAAVGVNFEDLLQVLLQFLSENGYTESFATLQKEASVSFRGVTDVHSLVERVQNGEWSQVLQILRNLSLIPAEVQTEVYVQIALEMILEREFSFARQICRESKPIALLKESDLKRFQALENAINEQSIEKGFPQFDVDAQRKKLVQLLLPTVSPIAPSRLMALLSKAVQMELQALNWEESSLELFDLCTGQLREQPTSGDPAEWKLKKELSLPASVTAECFAFDRPGSFVAVGRSDGAVSFFNCANFTPRADLPANVRASCAVMCIAISPNQEFIVGGDRSGGCTIWSLLDGSLINSVAGLHKEGIASVNWSSESTQILTSGFDCTAKLVGLKSDAVMRVYRGHRSFVNSAIFSKSQQQVLTASSDTTVRLWDAKTAECLFTLKPRGFESPLLSITSFGKADNFLVCSGGSALFEFNGKGVFHKTYHVASTKFCSAAVSPRFGLVYALAESGLCYVFDSATTKCLFQFVATPPGSEGIAVAMHPEESILLASDVSGKVQVFKNQKQQQVLSR